MSHLAVHERGQDPHCTIKPRGYFQNVHESFKEEMAYLQVFGAHPPVGTRLLCVKRFLNRRLKMDSRTSYRPLK